jgi:hypothetical protein
MRWRMADPLLAEIKEKAKGTVLALMLILPLLKRSVVNGYDPRSTASLTHGLNEKVRVRFAEHQLVLETVRTSLSWKFFWHR